MKYLLVLILIATSCSLVESKAEKEPEKISNWVQFDSFGWQTTIWKNKTTGTCVLFNDVSILLLPEKDCQ